MCTSGAVSYFYYICPSINRLSLSLQVLSICNFLMKEMALAPFFQVVVYVFTVFMIIIALALTVYRYLSSQEEA